MKKLLLGFLVVFLSACTSHSAPILTRSIPTQQRPKVTTVDNVSVTRKKSKISATHQVVKGDTLYSIAWQYGYDYYDIALWNDIRAPYIIYPGQVLRLTRFAASTEKKVQPTDPKNPAVLQPTEKSLRTADYIKWQWPTIGKQINLTSPALKKGISITGEFGQPIRAAASGEVVYSGEGLIGYGKVIILKHNKAFLSAYAYNDHILIEQGDIVNSGQQIATMGRHPTGKVLLHFEIRKNGQPTNPNGLLPL